MISRELEGQPRDTAGVSVLRHGMPSRKPSPREIGIMQLLHLSSSLLCFWAKAARSSNILLRCTVDSPEERCEPDSSRSGFVSLGNSTSSFSPSFDRAIIAGRFRADKFLMRGVPIAHRNVTFVIDR